MVMDVYFFNIWVEVTNFIVDGGNVLANLSGR